MIGIKNILPPLIFFLILLCSTDIYAQSAPLVLGTFAGPPLSNDQKTGFCDLILQEAFRRSNLQIDIVQLPAERSLSNANAGITDGDFVRIEGLDAVYPNLVRVPEEIIDFEFVGFSINVSIPTPDWQSLKPYDVAIVRGWKILEKNIVGTRSLVKVKNQRALFTLLKNNRADIVVYSKFEGLGVMRQLGIKDAHVLEPPLAVREMFLYLNKKHNHLVPIIDNNLKEMKQNGTFESIRKKSLSSYILGQANGSSQQ